VHREIVSRDWDQKEQCPPTRRGRAANASRALTDHEGVQVCKVKISGAAVSVRRVSTRRLAIDAQDEIKEQLLYIYVTGEKLLEERLKQNKSKGGYGGGDRRGRRRRISHHVPSVYNLYAGFAHPA
jgi:hypothetical protein